MRISSVSNQQQSFQAKVEIKGNARRVFESYGQKFTDGLSSLLWAIKTSALLGDAFISVHQKTKTGVQFRINFNIVERNGSKRRHNYVSVPDKLNPEQKAIKLALVVLKPFLKATEKNTGKVAKAA